LYMPDEGRGHEGEGRGQGPVEKVAENLDKNLPVSTLLRSSMSLPKGRAQPMAAFRSKRCWRHVIPGRTDAQIQAVVEADLRGDRAGARPSRRDDRMPLGPEDILALIEP
jgi:hypothetical protein